MVRRVSIPGADELFRSTNADTPAAEPPAAELPAAEPPVEHPPAERPPAGGRSRARRTPSEPRTPAERQPSGRVRHDEKVTVYVTAQELTEIESARLLLRSRHGLVVDRGRLVREAIAMALAELETEGEDSTLVRRLGGS